MISLLIGALFALLSLFSDSGLSQQAQARADDMAAHGYFAHDLSAYSGDYCAAGELLARGSNSAADVFGAWQQSPGHAYVLNEMGMDRAGIGVAVGPDGGVIWVLVVVRTC